MLRHLPSVSTYGWTQRRIAEACGTSASTVNRFIQTALRYRNKATTAYAAVTGEKAG